MKTTFLERKLGPCPNGKTDIEGGLICLGQCRGPNSTDHFTRIKVRSDVAGAKPFLTHPETAIEKWGVRICPNCPTTPQK